MHLLKKHLNFESALCALLFAFPLFATVVRHWTSGFYGLLVILGIIFISNKERRQQVELHRFEKTLLWLLVIHFAVFLLTMGMHYPERFSDTKFEVEVRFVLVIPLYFLLVKYRYGLRCLLSGAVLSVFIASLFCAYEMLYLNQTRFNGIYGPLYAGPIIFIYLAIAVSYYLGRITAKDKKAWILFLATLALATFVIVSSETRVAYIGYTLLALVFSLVYPRGRYKVIMLGTVLLCAIVIYVTMPPVKERMNTAFNEIATYLNTRDHAKATDIAGSSTGTRLEMWRTTPLFLQDHPLVGIGNGNYQKGMGKYVAEGKVNPLVLAHGHAHNVFVNTIIHKGLLGLLTVLGVFFYPLYIYIKTYRANKYTALTGIFFVTVMFMLSMNESAPFWKDNFAATYIILSLVIFQNHMKEIKKSDYA